MAARAALDAARVVFSPLSSGSAGLASAPQTPDVDAWPAAARVLEACTGRTDLDGQALVGEARRVGLLSLEDAYVLVALHSSPTDRPTGDAVLRALEGAVSALDRNAGVPFPSANAPLPQAAGDTVEPRRPAMSALPMIPIIEAPPARGSLSPGFILALLALVLLGGAGAWYALTQRAHTDDYAQGVEAYQRDAREVARLAFARAAKAHPDDARALVFLGRLAREDGNVPAARRFLDAAIRIAPENATANRELASVLLADGNPDLARRFYVRALQLDPADRLAQGFLACALIRLGRTEEAQRWSARAGPGDWSACFTPGTSSDTSASPANAPSPRAAASAAAPIPSPARP
jgi:tetratricopeptide (TPR) repeat protein